MTFSNDHLATPVVTRRRSEAIPRQAFEWCDFAQFSRREFRLLRQRHHLDVRHIYLRTRPRIASAEIKKWEAGTLGSVSEAFRRSLYEALRASIIDACDKMARRLAAHKDAETTGTVAEP